MSETGRGLSRSTIGLLAATLVAVLAAAYVIVDRNAEREPSFAPKLMFPNLASEIEAVERIHVETSTGSFEVVRDDGGAWQLPTRAGYPASTTAVRGTVLGLSTLELVEEKTARPQRHGALGLVAPDRGGDGVRLTLLGADDDVIATLVVGKVAKAEPRGRPSTLYVRYPDGDQSWLARTTLEVRGEVLDWIDKNIVDVKREDVTAAEIASADGTAYRLERGEGDDFTLADVPAGRTPKPSYTINTTAHALTSLAISDVKPAAEVDFSKATRARYLMKNGLALDLELVDSGDGRWMRLKADVATAPAEEGVAAEDNAAGEGEAVEEPLAAEDAAEADTDAGAQPGGGEAAAEDTEPEEGTSGATDSGEETTEPEESAMPATQDGAADSAVDGERETPPVAATPSPEVLAAEINSRTEGWAYAVPDFKYDQLTTPLEELLEPIETAEDPAPPGGP